MTGMDDKDSNGGGDKTGASSGTRGRLLAALALAAGFAAVYVTLGPRDNARPTGEMAAFVYKKAPEALAEVSFADGQGKPRTLKDWHGRIVLLNLWATWCAPCRKEMPALARLQKQLGSDKFEVVALAVDRAGAEAAGKFLRSIDAAALALYVDPTARAGTALKAAGMPTTLLIDGSGREIGRLTGAAEWDSPDALKLIRSYLK